MKKLIDICDIQYGYAFDSKCFTDDSCYPPLVRIRDVKRGYSETYYSGDYPKEYVLASGDLLVGMDGEFNIARWKCDGALLNQRVCKLIAKKGTNEEYLRFAMTKALKEIERRTAFVTVKHLSAKELNKLQLSVPDLSEQNRVAKILSRLEKVIAPLILPDGDEASAVRFDALMYGIELAYLVGKKYSRARTDLRKKVAGIANVANIPEIQAQSELVNKILNTDYVDNAGINEFEEIREKLRDLMKYIPKGTIKYVTNFTDELLSMEWKESELENDELKNYKAKAEYYIRQHQDNIAIAKLKTNRPLTSGDLASLEEILWREVGTKQDYEHEFGSKPLGEFVREIVGLDMNAAKEAFSEYLTGTNLDSRQIYFVNQIVEYIVHNGMMKDLSVLLESPFTDRGSVAEVFTDLNVWLGIRKVIDTINANAAA